jgi:hypothetical protein
MLIMYTVLLYLVNDSFVLHVLFMSVKVGEVDLFWTRSLSAILFLLS